MFMFQNRNDSSWMKKVQNAYWFDIMKIWLGIDYEILLHKME